MKTIIIIGLIVLMCGVAWGQEVTITNFIEWDDRDWTDWTPSYIFPQMDDLTEVIVGNDTTWTKINPYCVAPVLTILQLYNEYEQECYVDTIKAIMALGEYLFDHGSYHEMCTERQLEERGYKYRYRWVNNYHDSAYGCLVQMEYIFIKEPTLPGFIKFIRAKIREEEE